MIVQRRAGHWSHETVPTGNAVDVDLSYSNTLGLHLVVVQADTSLQRDGNSLVLWARQPDWGSVRRLVHGYGEGRVYDPSIVRSREGVLVSWETTVGEGAQSRRELRAASGRLHDLAAPVAVLDSDVSIWSEIQPLLLSDGVPLWVSHHPLPESESGEIRLTSLVGASAIELGRFANPYRFRMAAAAPAWSDLLITGMEYTPDQFAFSLLLRVRLECPGTP